MPTPRLFEDGPSLVIGGIPTVRYTRHQLAQRMVADHRRMQRGELAAPQVVVSSNGSVIAGYHRDTRFRTLIDAADIVDADGMPLVFASKLFCKAPLQERVATTDFIHDAAAAAEQHGIKFYFLGARPGVAAHAAETIRNLHPHLDVVGVRDGYFSLRDEEGICRDIVDSGADILWVGLGSPLQEDFAVRNRTRLAGLTWIRTCGGLFDHHAGSVRRAPLWMRNAGLEWLHRLLQEPRRLALRYIVTNPVAAFHLLTKTHD
jgi:exopolysaccharide biosynthesis WecB/TagA/CpsF family protein